MRSEGSGLCMCITVYLSVRLFSKRVSLHLEVEVPTASAQHGANYYKNEFCYNQKLWGDLLTVTSYGADTATFSMIYQRF